jgi:phospholipid/cholesterol/gamma-HCH transport system substrate-binding protein
MTPRTGQPRVQPGKRPPWSRLRVGLVALILIAIGTYFGFAKDIPFTHGYRLHAVFKSSNNLRPGSPVRIAGVNVGKVASVERYRDTDLTDVTLEIDDAGLPIHRDATLKIRPRIFLEGNFFVDLRPGSPSAPTVDDGGTIGPSQTSPPVQLDELLTALQADTRADLQTVLKEYGISLNAKPTAEEDALKGGALVNSALLGTEPHDLSRMISGVARLTGALRTREAELQDLIDNFNITAGSFAAQSESLQAAIGLLGPTLTTAHEALASVDAALPATRQFARDFLPAVQETPATVRAAFPWLEQVRLLLRRSELRGLLAELRPTTANLARFNAISADELLPQIDVLNRCFVEVVLPTGDIGVRDGALATRRPDGSIVENYKEFWYGMVGLAGEGSNFDGNGNLIRTGVGGGSYTFRGGRSDATGGTIVGNANRPPLGTSPRLPSGDLPYKKGVACHRNRLPAVNGPKAGPGPAPDFELSPTPPPIEEDE